MSRPLIVRILIFVEYSPQLASVPWVYVVPPSLEMYARTSVFKVTELIGLMKKNQRLASLGAVCAVKDIGY